MVAQRKISLVWQYFDEEQSDDEVVCRLCEQLWKRLWGDPRGKAASLKCLSTNKIRVVRAKDLFEWSTDLYFLWPDVGCMLVCVQCSDRLCCAADHRRSGGDATERKGAGWSQEEAGYDQTAAVQVSSIGAAGGRPGTVRACVPGHIRNDTAVSGMLRHSSCYT